MKTQEKKDLQQDDENWFLEPSILNTLLNSNGMNKPSEPIIHKNRNTNIKMISNSITFLFI
jgi:hypothetical protein